MCTAAALKALAVRTTEPMLRSCCQFSTPTWKSWRQLSRSATIASCFQYRYRSTTLRRSPSRSSSGSQCSPTGQGPVHGPTPTCGSALSVTSRSEEHTSELQSRGHLVCRLLLEKKNKL